MKAVAPVLRRQRWWILAAVALLALARWYAMSTPAHFQTWLPARWFAGEALSLTRSALNVACSWFFLVAIPLVACLWLRKALRHDGETPKLWGLGAPTFPSRTWIWAVLAVGAGAIVLGAAAVHLIPAVRLTYPVYRSAGNSASDLLLSEGLTVGLILATELFYRGIGLFALHRGFGRWAIWLIVPIYVLDHIGAPGAEVAGSAFAGVLLSYLAIRLKSIWPGFAVHAACAVTVDVVSALVGPF